MSSRHTHISHATRQYKQPHPRIWFHRASTSQIELRGTGTHNPCGLILVLELRGQTASTSGEGIRRTQRANTCACFEIPRPVFAFEVVKVI